MASIDLSIFPESTWLHLCMAAYEGLDRLMATPEGREYIETKTAERLARLTDKQTD